MPSGIPDTSVSSSWACGPSALESRELAPVQTPSQERTFYTCKAESPGFPGSLHLSQAQQVLQILRKAWKITTLDQSFGKVFSILGT